MDESSGCYCVVRTIPSRFQRTESRPGRNLLLTQRRTIFLLARSHEFMVAILSDKKITMNTGRKIFLAIVAAVLLVLGNYGYKMVTGGYRWKDRGAPHGAGPLDFAHWKSAIQNQVPSLVEVPVEKDPAQSFAFFFDAKANELVLCWYQTNELPNGGGYGISIPPDLERDVKEVARPHIQVQVPYSPSLGIFVTYNYATGLFLQIQKPSLSEFEFDFYIIPQDGRETDIHFKAQHRGSDGWVITRI